jgi:hypothetical protein
LQWDVLAENIEVLPWPKISQLDLLNQALKSELFIVTWDVNKCLALHCARLTSLHLAAVTG